MSESRWQMPSPVVQEQLLIRHDMLLSAIGDLLPGATGFKLARSPKRGLQAGAINAGKWHPLPLTWKPRLLGNPSA
eukprot:4592092-Alexandrium_andersonii.AAC.1